MDRILNWFIRAWIGLAVAINVVAIIGFFVRAHGFVAGWMRVSEIYGPYNLTNWLMELVLISPAFGAYLWLERRRKRATGPQQPMTAQEVQEIVHAYGEAMTVRDTAIRDARRLPYPKERIKLALLFALHLTTDPKMRDSLQGSYLTLAEWQEGVGDAFAAFRATADDPVSQAKRIVTAHPAVKKGLALCKAETVQLLDELTRAGFAVADAQVSR